MSDLNMFIAGDYELDDLSQVPINTSDNFNFARKRRVSMRTKKSVDQIIPGTRQAHIRNVKGKLVQVKQSLTQAGAKTAGQLKAIGSQGLEAGKKYGGQAIEAGKKYGGQAIESGKKYGGQALTVVKQNPKASAAIAATGVVGGTVGYLSGRKKRNRNN